MKAETTSWTRSPLCPHCKKHDPGRNLSVDIACTLSGSHLPCGCRGDENARPTSFHTPSRRRAHYRRVTPIDLCATCICSCVTAQVFCAAYVAGSLDLEEDCMARLRLRDLQNVGPLLFTLYDGYVGIWTTSHVNI
ncbi:hypothetical protein K402DRAFT_26697 [Aulographum hederae CBS 113979]|uniref:Uncharacterized protein n=1 Tax=Aulographum hederae CBS 113979 TaxID=1176131 RepID=A0A6G1H5S3_9PEZI|nr:hypothetical protein K402DRAFT_26697 [Aulographum hederae CBS 113979]